MSERARILAKKPEAKKEASVSRTRKTDLSRSMKSPANHILFLQRTIGNQAVQRLMKSGALQTKLAIGKPGDMYEQEADRVAEQVMRMPEPEVQRQVEEEEKKEEEEEEELLQAKPISEQIMPLIQRQVEEEEEILQTKGRTCQTPEITPNLESRIQSLRGGGQSLPESTRAFFEPRFGHDFSNVRLHTDVRAAETARAVNAQAFTLGHDIVFGVGQYAPETTSGQRLLAHELTHVVQQTWLSSSPRGKLTIGQLGSVYEQEADKVAQRVGGNNMTIKHKQGVERIHRQEGKEKKEEKTPEKLNKMNILKYFNGVFDKEFKDKGLFKFFSLSFRKYKKIDSEKKLKKGIPIFNKLEECWSHISSDLRDLKTDVRSFKTILILKTEEDEKTSKYIEMHVKLFRRAVKKAEESKIEKTLVNVESKYAYGSKSNLKLEKNTYNAYKKLYKAAEGENFMKEIPDLFKIQSAYRSVTKQETLWKNKCDKLREKNPTWSEDKIEKEARKWVAKPGGSAHHTGYAVDLYMGWKLASSNATKIKNKKSDLYKKYGKYWEWLKEMHQKRDYYPTQPNHGTGKDGKPHHNRKG